MKNKKDKIKSKKPVFLYRPTKWDSRVRRGEPSLHMQRRAEEQSAGESGFTLVELLMSLVIMGMILFVINVVLISVLKSSARTDTMIRLDNYIETSYEIIERNVKSAEPSSLCIAEYNETGEVWECNGETSGNAIMMNLLSDLKTTVVFYFEEDEDETGILKSYWIKYNSERVVVLPNTTTYLSNPSEIDVETFEVDIALNNNTGIHQVILRTLSDSIDVIGVDDPLINDMLRTANIVTRGKEI